MKRLHLSASDKKIAGVCSGIADYMGIDPTIVRLIAVMLALITAVIPFCIAYVIAWMIIPASPPH